MTVTTPNGERKIKLLPGRLSKPGDTVYSVKRKENSNLVHDDDQLTVTDGIIVKYLHRPNIWVLAQQNKPLKIRDTCRCMEV